MAGKTSYGRILLLSTGLVCTLLTAFVLALRSELSLTPEPEAARPATSAPLSAILGQSAPESLRENERPDGGNAALPLSSQERTSSFAEEPFEEAEEAASSKAVSRPGRQSSVATEERPSSAVTGVNSSKPRESSPSAGSEAPSQEESAPVSQPDLAALRKENDRCAASLSARIGIPVIILREERPEARPVEEVAASSALSLAESAFDGYGSGLLRGELGTLVLAGTLSAGKGLCLEGKMLWVDCFTFRQRELRELLYNRAESILLRDGVPELSGFNPEDFHYGLPREEYVWMGSPVEAAFFSMEAQTSARADFCGLFRKALEDPAALTSLPEDCLLWEKARFCCKVFAERIPLLQDNYAVAYFAGE